MSGAKATASDAPAYLGGMAGWVERQYSRTQIENAGRLLIREGISEEERINAIHILDNWRACHSFPMNTFQVALRSNARKICGPTSIVAQRLKRTPSIIAKLRRQQNMSLKRMQDIAGCRAVVLNVAKANNLLSHGLNLKMLHELVGVKDYIQHPKPDGYQSIHMVWKYKSPLSETFNDQLVEIQIRSKLQHSWATAVETADTMNHTRLKQGLDQDTWGRFFKLMGAIFAIEEKTGGRIEGIDGSANAIREEAAQLAHDLDVVNKLVNFGRLFNLPEQLRKAEFYLMTLLPDTRQLRITGYRERQIELATQHYSMMEEHVRDKPGAQVVLVSAGSVQALKKAYPNYYADTTIFIQHVRRLTKETWPTSYEVYTKPS